MQSNLMTVVKFIILSGPVHCAQNVYWIDEYDDTFSPCRGIPTQSQVEFINIKYKYKTND